MKALMTMRNAIEHPDIFGSILPGDSWASWRVLLIAIMGEKLAAAERVIFVELTGRATEPGERVDEFWGHGSPGRQDARHCRAGRVHSGSAASLYQANKAFQYLDGIFSGVPAFKKLVIGQTSDTISLKTRVDIECRPATFRTIRGGTCVAIIGDEAAFWRSDKSANPDTEILNAARPPWRRRAACLRRSQAPMRSAARLTKPSRTILARRATPISSSPKRRRAQ